MHERTDTDAMCNPDAVDDRAVADHEAEVMVVEDDADVRGSLRAIIAQAGYSVVGAEDGFRAIRLLKAGLRPRLIILDLMLPAMSGREFRQAQLRDPALAGIPVVVCSALHGVDYLASRLGAIAGLTKPIDIDELLRLIAEHCPPSTALTAPNGR